MIQYPKIIIPTCDKYRNILEANKYSIDRFGGSDLDVTILGYEKPDFDLGNWKFVSLGNDTGANNFTNDISKFFQTFDDEYFIYGNDDCIFTNPINFGLLDKMCELIPNISKFGRIWLLNAPAEFYGVSKIIKDFGCYKIEEINQDTHYRLSLQYSLWKTSYFKKYLIPNISPWGWEIRDVARNDGYSILLPTNNQVIGVGHVMKKGVYLPNWFNSIHGLPTELTQKDVDIITNVFKKHKILN
jgi:hypothetical protein